jgi:predicted homoserine dehydrogenase-like protein
VDRLPDVLKPEAAGGILGHSGTVEVVASENRDGTPVKNHLRWGLYVVFKALTDYMLEYMSSHESQTDASGQYSVVYRPFHLIGLELGMSVASVALRGEDTGSPASFVADVASMAKKDLSPGDILDGEGGYTVFGRLVRAEDSVSCKYLPIGLGRGVKVIRPVARGSFLTYDDLEMDSNQFSFKLRRQLEEELRAAIKL